SLLVWASGTPLVWQPAGLWLLAATGIGIMVATLLLYWGLARGPVTVVAPIVGSYPALNVVLALVLGVRPTTLQWAAMAAVLTGVVLVAVAARAFEDGTTYTRRDLRKTVLIALSSSVSFAFAVAAAQGATAVYGELQTVWAARWVSLAAVALLLALRRRRPAIPGRWWPILVLQGLLDGGAYLALVAGSEGPGSAITVVVASGFGAVTVLLARVFLREAMTWGQWAGVALVVVGVAVLSGQ
ncbi:MAG: DMT family transporter, partial [Rhodospirillales bacterium]|nr:DMT family transporter [Rhodospirillales bacterium]